MIGVMVVWTVLVGVGLLIAWHLCDGLSGID